MRHVRRQVGLTLLIIPTVDFVTLTVLTLALCALLIPAFVEGDNLTGSARGTELRIYISAPDEIILDDHELNERIPLLVCQSNSS